MSIVKLSDEHIENVLSASESHFEKKYKQMQSMSPISSFTFGFSDGYETCFNVYDCGHKKAVEYGVSKLVPNKPKANPHKIDKEYSDRVILTSASEIINKEKETIEVMKILESYQWGFLEGYTKCWNAYELHDLEHEMGEIIDPTPEEIALVKRIVEGWDITKET